MYEWWVRFNRQSPQIDIEQTYKDIVKWGAEPSRALCLTELQYSFKSVKNPTRKLNKLRGAGVVGKWGFFYKSQLAKPRRKITHKRLFGEEKTEKFSELKQRYGKTLDPGG